MLGLIRRTVRSAFNKLGYTISRIEPDLEIPAFDEQAYRERVAGYAAKLAHLSIHKAHFGCGVRLLGDDWINIDLAKTSPDPEKLYLYADLTSRHPFADNYFDYAFAEDFLEHLDQVESIIFLSESFRTLKPGGVLRLSSPGLNGVFKSHYHSSDYQGAARLQ
ncbi:MAG: methyltransferase domain-containing protein [Gammaproteobacteria bacterium]|nr:methyltransferase domain-containing protein [Gammaproteobacteria bacterium]